MIIWITGLSGSGKTTLARNLYLKIKKKAPNTIWIDGDNFRRDVAPKVGYSKKERDKLFSTTCGFIKFCNKRMILGKLARLHGVQHTLCHLLIHVTRTTLLVCSQVVTRKNRNGVERTQ